MCIHTSTHSHPFTWCTPLVLFVRIFPPIVFPCLLSSGIHSYALTPHYTHSFLLSTGAFRFRSEKQKQNPPPPTLSCPLPSMGWSLAFLACSGRAGLQQTSHWLLWAALCNEPPLVANGAARTHAQTHTRALPMRVNNSARRFSLTTEAATIEEQSRTLKAYTHTAKKARK